MIAAVVASIRSGSGPSRTVRTVASRTASVTRIEGVGPRMRPAQSWTGDRLFVFGGVDPSTGNWTLQNDGALVHPATGDTATLPTPPFDPPLWSPRAIAPGSGEESEPTCEPGTYAAATFDLASSSWAAVEIPGALREFRSTSRTGLDAVVRGLGATSDGRAVLVLGSYLAPQYWTYSPSSGEWRQLPDPGVRSDAACVSEDRLFVLTTKYQQGGVVLDSDPLLSATPGQPVSGYEGDGYVEPSLRILDLSGSTTWHAAPSASGVKFTTSPPRLACMGTFAMAVSQLSPAESLALYDTHTDQWSLPARPPIDRVFNGEVWTGKELVFLPLEVEVGALGEAYNPTTNRWRALGGFPAVTRGALWSGAAIVGYSEPLATRAPVDLATDPERQRRPTINPAGVFRFVPR
jgi:hypothetical protein